MIYRGMPIEEYRSGKLADHISQSTIKSPSRKDTISKKAALDGTLTHRFLEIGCSAKELEIVRAEFKDEATTKEIDEAHELAVAMVDKMPTCPEVWHTHIVEKSDRELSMTWEMGGLNVKGRPDCVSADGKVMLDYKTTSGISRFKNSIWDCGYDIQAAFYLYGLAANECIDELDIPTCMMDKRYYLCVAEKKTAKVGFYLMSPESINFGLMRVWNLIEKYKKYVATGNIESETGDTYETVHVPAWLRPAGR